MPEGFEDTIAAVSTPRGVGGISIVRISGKDALKIADSVLCLRNGKPVSAMKSWSARLSDVVWDDGPGDVSVVLLMRAPRSYTGEDMVEVQCHGGVLSSSKTLSAILQAGARHAEPGEFTRRAFLSGRISLEEAEAVLDVIAARTERALGQATRRLQGELGALVTGWETRLHRALAGLVASADFPEDIDNESREALAEAGHLAAEIGALLRKAPLGMALSTGIRVCLVGAPNSGKSSLFNALSRTDRAIVTHVPGTTRDVLREHVQWDGLPVVLLDTAGLRDTSDIVEMIGVRRAEEAADESEVILFVIDASKGPTKDDVDRLSRWVDEGRKLIAVASKADVVAQVDWACDLPSPCLVTSSVTGQGLSQVKDAVVAWFAGGEAYEGVLPSSARQVDCLRKAARALDEAVALSQEGWSEDVLVLLLQEAAQALAGLTGKNAAEEVLEQVFANFCVGK